MAAPATLAAKQPPCCIDSTRCRPAALASGCQLPWPWPFSHESTGCRGPRSLEVFLRQHGHSQEYPHPLRDPHIHDAGPARCKTKHGRQPQLAGDGEWLRARILLFTAAGWP